MPEEKSFTTTTMQQDLRISQIMRDYLIRCLHENVSKIVGRALTIVDAISENETRRKAIHDLIEQGIWDNINTLRHDIFFACDCLSQKLDEPQSPSQGLEVTMVNIFERY